MDLIEILLAIILSLLLLRFLSQPYRSKIMTLLRSRSGGVLSRMVSGGISVGILLLAAAMLRGGAWLLIEERHSAYKVSPPVLIPIIFLLCATAGICGYAVWRFARFAVTGSQKTSSHPL